VLDLFTKILAKVEMKFRSCLGNPGNVIAHSASQFLWDYRDQASHRNERMLLPSQVYLILSCCWFCRPDSHLPRQEFIYRGLKVESNHHYFRVLFRNCNYNDKGALHQTGQCYRSLLSRWAAKQQTLHGPAAGFHNEYKLLIAV